MPTFGICSSPALRTLIAARRLADALSLGERRRDDVHRVLARRLVRVLRSPPPPQPAASSEETRQRRGAGETLHRGETAPPHGARRYHRPRPAVASRPLRHRPAARSRAAFASRRGLRRERVRPHHQPDYWRAGIARRVLVAWNQPARVECRTAGPRRGAAMSGRTGRRKMVRSGADRLITPTRGVFEEVGDMMILTGKTIVSALRPPYPYGGEFVSQFLFALRLCWFPLLVSTVAFGYGAPGSAGRELPRPVRRARPPRRLLRARLDPRVRAVRHGDRARRRRRHRDHRRPRRAQDPRGARRAAGARRRPGQEPRRPALPRADARHRACSTSTRCCSASSAASSRRSSTARRSARSGRPSSPTPPSRTSGGRSSNA